MKNIKYLIGLFLTLTFIVSCEDDDYKFGDIVTPSNVQVTAEIVGQDLSDPELLYGDGAGFVTFEATADNVISYSFNFGDGYVEVAPSGKITHRYTKVGVNTFTVIVSAIGTGGVSSTTSIDVEVYSSFTDVEAEDLLSGGIIGEGKTWYWAADLPLHVGMGPVSDDYGSLDFAWPNWWNAIQPWDDEKGCMYTNEFVFTKTENGITFEQTTGPAFIPGTYAGILGVDGDTCHDETVATTMFGVKNVSMFPSSSKAALEGLYYDETPYRQTAFEISDGGFMGWYVGSSTYDIITITEDYLQVRIEEAGGGAAWYQLFTSTKPVQDEGFTELAWADEFDTDGAPDATKWTYDLGAGGWGNNEAQTYTDDAANVIIADGVLKITAKAEGDSYTSARLKTQGLYSFTYGRVDVRAKLPSVAGTWPAIWMLGDSFDSVGWPKSGEIDIMEQTGADKNTVGATCHWFDEVNSVAANYGLTTSVANASTEFHVYSLEWTEESIKVFVDDVKYYEMTNSEALPFNADFFLILNVAMGGSLGGDIDPAFTEDYMEVDYVRVYQ
ncbi:family 16 glycosylhydrolase [Lutibacter sp. B1]|uniref:family 16 glycosylhydrolase n=1 Tax=Lutibacter sp. B1 TaxID=2725996 RepID=UPI001456CC30|nr:family 16 glycosylhydrolase [Lutibacter sp. B1]NLP57100.1 family 16 glycosylhydrolase [Lutibacter sp. B1]